MSEQDIAEDGIREAMPPECENCNRLDQICQMMNGALEPKGITPENLAERVGSLIVSLEKALKKNHHYEELAKL